MPHSFWPYTPPTNHRLSPHLYAIAGQTAFITIRTTPGTAPFSSPAYARIAIDCLLAQRAKSHCQVDVYCVMPDHIHLLVTPIDDGASSLAFIDRFKGWCSHELHLAGWIGPVWQRRSYDYLLRVEDSIEEIGRYILGNPVRAGIVENMEDYPWSGIPEPIMVIENGEREDQ